MARDAPKPRRGSAGAQDPLDRALQPPADETQEERTARLAREREAKLVSDAIDERIEAERVQETKGPKPVKVLLLGQSESGKSTTLKNFQLMYEPKAFRQERASWRAVIQLNVVRSFHVIMDAISRSHRSAQNPHSVSFSSLNEIQHVPLSLLELKQRLQPLLHVEATLISRLNPAGSGETEATQRPLTPTSTLLSADSALGNMRPRPRFEVAVNSAKGWKRLLVGGDESSGSEDGDGVDWANPEEPGQVLYALREDMIRLWNDPATHEVLAKQEIKMQELAGFFLDQLDRVTSQRYMPTDDDILKARLKTLGVTEHRFTLTTPAWIPYFDDMDSIIFLAPISCFDQTLVEDPKINRLADSVSIWTDVCSSKLLKDTNLILFLNKVDIFREKIAAGTKLADYIVSYGKRPNEFEPTSQYIRKKFADIQKEKSPLPRVFYSHFTTVTDTKSTSFILAGLKDIIMRGNLARTDLALA